MVKNLCTNYLTPLIISSLLSTQIGFSQENSDCTQFRTQTQGGWGTRANGGNPGSYRDTHFDDAFPNGITLGCNYTLHFTSSESVESFLPSGTSARVLEDNYTNPDSYRNVFAGQLLALTLSVGFDNSNSDFSDSNTSLSQQIVNSGTFEGFNVQEVLNMANDLLGGCDSPYSPSEMNAVLSSINENYVDGTQDNGYLDCPPIGEECSLGIEHIASNCNPDGTYNLNILISGSNTAFEVIAEDAIAGNGISYCFGDSTLGTVLEEIEITLVFPEGIDYTFEVIQKDLAQCASTVSNNCSVPEIFGPAPVCCNLEIECFPAPNTSFQCIGDIPEADLSSIEIISSCKEPTINISESTFGSGCANNPFTLERTYTVIDGIQEVQCVQSFEVIDHTPPTIICPPTQTVDCWAAIVPDAYATATDNCSQIIQISYTDGQLENCSQFFRTWTAVDECGNTSQCIQTVIVSDQTPPVLTAPQNVVVDCGYDISPVWIGVATAVDYCSDVYITYQDGIPEGEGCSTTITRTWIATDGCGNSSTAEQIITQTDMTGPSIFGVPNTPNLQCGEIPPAPAGLAVDNCSGDTLDVEMVEFVYEQGCRTTISRTYSSTDACGNTTYLYRIFNIEDTQGPTMTCPSDVLLACGEENIDPSNTGMLEAIDNCSGEFVIISFEDGQRNNSVCPPGFNRYWTAVDTCGNVSNCVQQILFDDQVAPEISCLDAVTINCSNQNTSPEFTGTPVAIDDCSDAQVQFQDGPIDGNCPASFIRTWSASDACGNTSYCYQQITVIDEEAPIITCPSDITISCAQQNALPSLTGYASATDCLNVSLTYEDGEILGDCEKSFTRTWIAQDACGNTATCAQIIHFEDNMLPVIFCPADTMLSCGDDISPEFTGMATAVDFCSEVTVSFSDTEIENACPPGVARTWTATDACGNTRTCVQTILFHTFDLPTIECPEDITISCEIGTDPIFTGSPTVESYCSNVMVSYTDSIVYQENDSDGFDCGQLRTQTQGGWGTRANGGNPGTYRDAHFDEAFPNGLVVGCEYTLTLTSSEAVQAFLPNGGPIRTLSQNLVNPNNFRTVFAGQLVALTLSVGFDMNDESFGPAQTALSDMVIGSGDFEGTTVSDVLDIANAYFGGCPVSYSGTALNSVLTAINENYVDGTSDNGFLECPEEVSNPSDGCGTIYRTWTVADACDNEVNCVQTITLSDDESLEEREAESFISTYPSPTEGALSIAIDDKEEMGAETILIQVLDVSGMLRLEQANSQIEIIQLDLSDLEPGTYILRTTRGNRIDTRRIVKI